MAVILDEAGSPPLHRWMSFARLLMSTHPRTGAMLYAIHVGDETLLMPGWNAVHHARGARTPTTYIWIDAVGGTGRSTDVRPPVPDHQIRAVAEDDLPELERTAAWRQLTELSTILLDHTPPGVPGDWIASITQAIQSAARRPLRQDAATDERIARILRGIYAEAGRRHRNTAWVHRPILAVADDCLGFRITCTHAYNVVAAVIARVVLDVCSGGPGLALEQMDHLIALTGTLVAQRQDYDLGSFSTLTYLGLLWGNAALLIARGVGSHVTDPAVRKTFERRGLYVDEMVTHELAPSLLAPITWMPLGIREFFHAAQVGWLYPRGLYAGAGQVGRGAEQIEQVWDRVQAYSRARATAKELAVRGGGDFLCPAMKDALARAAQTRRPAHSRPWPRR